MDDRTLKAGELAAYLQVNPETVYRWVRAGCPHLNVGSGKRPDYRFVLSEVEAWLRSRG